MTNKQSDMIRVIMSSYTYEQQREIFVEECAEAIQAAQKCKRATTDNYTERRGNLKEEVADVLIMAEQMRQYIGAKDIDKIIDTKLRRQIERIKEEV